MIVVYCDEQPAAAPADLETADAKTYMKHLKKCAECAQNLCQGENEKDCTACVAKIYSQDMEAPKNITADADPKPDPAIVAQDANFMCAEVQKCGAPPAPTTK